MKFSHLCFFLEFLLLFFKDIQCYKSNQSNHLDNWYDNEVESEGRKCPVAFTDIGGRCYFYGYFKLNWFRAMEFCHSFGSTVSLACLETSEENEYLKKWLLNHGDHTTGVWVGGSDNGHIGRWAWFPTGQLIKNFNWGPSQPSGGDQHCMYIVGGYLGYQWADFHCGFEMTFMCEYDVNPVQAWRRRREMLPKKSKEEISDNFENASDSNTNLDSNEYQTLESTKDVVKFSDSAEKAFLKQKKTGFIWPGYFDKTRKTVSNQSSYNISAESNNVENLTAKSQKRPTSILITKQNKISNLIDSEQYSTSTLTPLTTLMPTEPASKVFTKEQLSNDTWSIYSFLKSVVKSGG